MTCAPAAMDLEALDRLDCLGGAGGGEQGAVVPAIAGVWQDNVDRLEALGNGGGDAIELSDEDPAAEFDVDRVAQLGRSKRAAPPPPQHARRSYEAMAHARRAREEKRQKRVDAEKADELNVAQAQLARVQRNYPGVANACELSAPVAKRTRTTSSASTSATSGNDLSEERAHALVRAAFSARKIPAGLGIRYERLVCFMANLLEDLSVQGLLCVLRNCALLRKLPDKDVQHQVFLGLAHESDTTSQTLAQHAIQRVGRPSAARLATEVLQQRGTFYLTLARVNRRTGELLDRCNVSVPWPAKPVVLLGKSAPLILKGLSLGMPFDMCGLQWEAWAGALAAATDSALLLQVGDKGSSNFPAMRHIAAVRRETTKYIRDLSPCELHNLQNLKNMSVSVKQVVGRIYMMSNIMKTATFVDGLCRTIEFICEKSVRRIVSPPPADEANDLRDLLEALYDFDVNHHKRDTTGESILLKDLKV